MKKYQQIFEDLELASELLPLDYENIDSDAEVPAKYKEIGAQLGNYNLVFGTYQRGRLTMRIVEAIKAQVALLAASPAYRGSEVTSETAANYAAAVLNRIGGVTGLDPKGHTWYMNTEELDNLGSGEVSAEILWRGNKSIGTEDWDMGIKQEKDNFPPTFYGSGPTGPKSASWRLILSLPIIFRLLSLIRLIAVIRKTLLTQVVTLVWRNIFCLMVLNLRIRLLLQVFILMRIINKIMV